MSSTTQKSIHISIIQTCIALRQVNNNRSKQSSLTNVAVSVRCPLIEFSPPRGLMTSQLAGHVTRRLASVVPCCPEAGPGQRRGGVGRGRGGGASSVERQFAIDCALRGECCLRLAGTDGRAAIQGTSGLCRAALCYSELRSCYSADTGDQWFVRSSVLRYSELRSGSAISASVIAKHRLLIGFRKTDNG